MIVSPATSTQAWRSSCGSAQASGGRTAKTTAWPMPLSPKQPAERHRPRQAFGLERQPPRGPFDSAATSRVACRPTSTGGRRHARPPSDSRHRSKRDPRRPAAAPGPAAPWLAACAAAAASGQASASRPVSLSCARNSSTSAAMCSSRSPSNSLASAAIKRGAVARSVDQPPDCRRGPGKRKEFAIVEPHDRRSRRSMSASVKRSASLVIGGHVGPSARLDISRGERNALARTARGSRGRAKRAIWICRASRARWANWPARSNRRAAANRCAV